MTLVEAAVETLRSAVSAERGGTGRVELCANLDEGGTTPDLEVISAVCARVRIPVLAIVRPRAGGYVYSATEMRGMLDIITRARTLGLAGIVAGVLRADDTVDVDRMRQIVDAAAGLPVTFHRAFDATASLQDALEDIIASGASRLLTSGGAATALEGAEVLAALVDQAGERITIVAGGGIRENNVRDLIVRSRVREIPTRLSAGEDLDEVRMRGLIELVRSIP